MKQIFKKIIPNILLDYLHWSRVSLNEKDIFINWRQKKYDEWIENGRVLPPPHAVKQYVINNYRVKYNIKSLIETGTFRGEMIESQKVFFDEIYSIELDKTLHDKAKNTFKYFRNIKLIHGDSGEIIFKIISKIKKKSIFWLDGHYSGMDTALGDVECPILKELDGVFSGKIKNHILLIDDARCFTGNNSYPTIDELYNYVLKYNKEYKMEVDCDIIRFIV